MVAVAAAVLLAGRLDDGSGQSPAVAGATPGATALPSAAPAQLPGHEVYGYLPYWEMDDGIAEHLASTPLTTLGLFSVTHTRTGELDAGQSGYRRIAGGIGERLVREAHERGVRVELVYTSFGYEKNARLFADDALQDAVIASLVAFSAEHGLDGINVDVELLEASDVLAFGGFLERLDDALAAALPTAQVSVATGAGERGALMAAAAGGAGVDRIFLMGYDYHVAASQPGASAPLDRADGGTRDLAWSLDLYASLGVPVDRTILGLPLYGMSWPVDGPELDAMRTGRGEPWIPADNLDLLADPTLAPVTDDVQAVERLAIEDGAGWRAIYFDSPSTLARKLALADGRGLAGAGLWALGYERGLPAYTDLIATFAAGDLEVASEAPLP